MNDLNKLKCECGHVNPEGTVLCESCGKPVAGNEHIDGNDQKKLLNMRYEGSARRSQTYNRSIVDKTWNFFSSVKVGVMLIIIALIASGIGTIFPQQMYIPIEAENRDPAVFYEDWYGLPGKIYYQLGFHELYSSWWYLILIALIGISLVICSIDRFVPLYRALKMQRPKRHAVFLSRQRFFSKTDKVTEDEKQLVMDRLKKARYKIVEENGNILAEKNRFSRWGPYVNHIGLIIILLAALLRMTPLFYLDDYVWVREGEDKVIPSTNQEYYIENKRFLLESYDETDEKFQAALEKTGEVHKNYQTDVIIYKNTTGKDSANIEDMEVVKQDSIQMNKPLKFANYTLYQSGYQQNEFSEMTFIIHETADSEKAPLGEITIDLYDPEHAYELDNGFIVELTDYYPDYELKDGEPRSKTKFPRNPAFVMSVYPPGEEEGELSFIGIGKNIDATEENKYKLGIIDFDVKYASGLTVRRDYTLPLFGIGAAIFMIGVIQGMYWYHRRIWINPDGEGILLAAHTNKNWHGLEREIEKIIDGTNIKMIEDQEENKELSTEDSEAN